MDSNKPSCNNQNPPSAAKCLKSSSVTLELENSTSPDKKDLLSVNSKVSPIKPEDLSSYQISEEYPPNQLKVWEKDYPRHLNENLMIDTGDSLLSEVDSMKEALIEVQKSGPLASWACESIRAWFEGHYEWLSAKNTIFHSYFLPRTGKRFHFPVDVIQAQCDYFAKLQSLSSMINNLKENDSVDDLLQVWLSYEASVSHYLQLQTAKIIILYHAFFSPSEVADITKRVVSNSASTRTGAFIHFVGVDHFRKTILPREHFPSVAWELNFKKHYDAYLENSVVHLSMLFSGYFAEDTPESSIVENCRKKRRKMEEDHHIFFNPFDPMYQVSKEFPPNKLDEWEEDFVDHVKQSSRYAVNQAHLGEASDLLHALIAVKERGLMTDWELSSIQEWFRAHKKWITDLHKDSSELAYPFYEKRFHYPKVLIDGHEEHIQFLEQMSAYLGSLRAGSKVDGLLDLWTTYSNKLDQFFDLFNRMHFQLVHAYFSRKEIADWLNNYVDKNVPGVGPTIYYQGKEKFRKELMKRESLNDLRWHLDFGKEYITYVEKVAIHIKALKTGVPPRTDDDRGKTEILSILNELWHCPTNKLQMLE